LNVHIYAVGEIYTCCEVPVLYYTFSEGCVSFEGVINEAIIFNLSVLITTYFDKQRLRLAKAESPTYRYKKASQPQRKLFEIIL